MPMFHYEATDKNGRRVVGSMDVADEAAVRARLAQGGYTPTLIEASARAKPENGRKRKAAPGGLLAATPPAPGAGRPADGIRRGVSVSTRDLAMFYRQMATSLRAGVPLTQAIAHMQARVRGRVMRAALGDIEEAIERGRPISEAMDRHPRAFRIGHVGLVRAGEGGGFLEGAFTELANQTEADWGIEAATRFNILLFIIKWGGLPVMGAWVYFMAHLVPLIGGTVTGVTVMAIAVRALFVGVVVALGLNVALPLAWRLTKGTALGDFADSFAADIPLVNARRKRVDVVKSLSSLASAMEAGVPSTVAWQLAAEAADTPRFRHAMAAQGSAVRQGKPLPEVLAATRLFDRDTLDLVRSGDESGSVPEMLAQAVHYKREEARHIGNLTPWLLGVAAYFLLMLVGAALYIWAAQGIYGGILEKGTGL